MNNMTLKAVDTQNNPVKIEWCITNMFSPEYAESMKEVAELGIATFTDVELNFLKAFPEVVGKEPYFKSFEPFFEKGPSSVDWQQVETVMQKLIKSHFIIDVALISDAVKNTFSSTAFIGVQIKSVVDYTLLGYMTCVIQPEFTKGTVKITGIAVNPAAQGRGLAKLLMGSLFKIVPDLQRIFLCTRITNTSALNAYTACGFTKDENPLQDSKHMFNLNHWVFMEYNVQKTKILQTVAAGLA